MLDTGNKMRTCFCVLNRDGYDQRDTIKETQIVCFCVVNKIQPCVYKLITMDDMRLSLVFEVK